MRSRIAWWLFVFSVLVAGAALTLWARTRSLDVSVDSRKGDAGLIVAFLAYAAVGSLIVSRRFGNLVGWIFLATGLLAELGMLAQEYAVYALRESPGSLPGGSWVGLMADLFPVAFFGLGTFLLLVYPTGRMLSRRWLAVVWLYVASALILGLGLVLEPGTLSVVTDAPKPIEVDFLLFTEAVWAWPSLLLAGLLAIVSVILRYRRGDALERQQLRWFLAAVPIVVVAIFWVPASEGLATVMALGMAALPVAAGIAIFRYHLYDLGLVVRRTLIYGILTAGLAGLYFGIVIGLQAVFGGLTRGNDLAIAGSTLAVAALFRPARRWLQAIVDRRFYRRRYDAEQTLAAFSSRLRDEVDLQALETELGRVVSETLKPSHVSLWLRPQKVDR